MTNELKPQTIPELNIAELSGVLWKNRMSILGFALLCSILGAGASYLVTPKYSSEAIISLKETAKTGGISPLLGQLGGIGSVVASQFGGGSNPLFRLEILAKNRDIAEEVINKNQLLPFLFPKQWNGLKKEWRGRSPEILAAVERMRTQVVTVEANHKKGFILLKAETSKPELSQQIVTDYIEAMNKKIIKSVRAEAKANQDFLEKQLQTNPDPMLREKLLNLIANEVEKAMLVSYQSIEVLEPPIKPLQRSKPRRKLYLLVSVTLGFGLAVIVVVLRKSLESG